MKTPLILAALLFMTLMIPGATGQTVTPLPTWTPWATCPPGNTIPLPDTSLYNQTMGDLFGYGNFQITDIGSFLWDTQKPFSNAYGWFYVAGLFGALALGMYIVQESIWIPIILFLLGGIPTILFQLPLTWQKGIGTVFVLGITGLLYAARKKRY